jgi:hypothetical protein
MHTDANVGLAGRLILMPCHLENSFLLAFAPLLAFGYMSSNLDADATASKVR